MIETPMDVPRDHPVRRSRKQKKNFRAAVRSYAEGLGYQVTEEKGRGNVRNLILGDPDTARFLITAHYDTPAALWGVNLLMPCSAVMFVLSQLFNALILMLPAALIGYAAWDVTRDPLTAYLTLSAAVIFSVLLMFIGPSNRRNANGNTSGVVALLETAASMPQQLRRRVCFVLFDAAVPAMAGSSEHFRLHKFNAKRQTVINLDCVGDGDEIVFFPSEPVRRDVNLMCMERKCGPKAVRIHGKRFQGFSSDHVNFPRSVGVMALRRGKLGPWLTRTHTFRDTVLDYTNINILRACLTSYISGPAAE